MKKQPWKQRLERKIAAMLRIFLVALLLAVQVAVVLLLAHVLHQRMIYAYVLLQIAAIVCAVRIYQRSGDFSYKAGWIILVLSLPVAGIILYYLWHGNHAAKHLGLKALPVPQESEAQRAASRRQIEKLRHKYPAWGRLAAQLDHHGYSLYDRTDMTYFSSGEAYLEDVLRRMERAEHFIFMEYYIVSQGDIWEELSCVLRRKAAEGVEVKVIFDDFGSMLRLSRQEIATLRAAGVEVQSFNPVHQYVNRLYFNYRDHRKITCIDGETAYTGGVNLADEYANRIVRFGHWKDCGVRLDGQGAWGLTRQFIHMWERMGGTLQWEHEYYRPHTMPESAGFCQCIADGPDNNPANPIEDAFLQMIAMAKHMVYITTPYLAIDEPMLRALCIAGDSGVDVRLMVPGIPDHKTAHLLAESYFEELLHHGVKIYRYEPGLLHGKTVMADREVAFVGTANMDYRSFQLHFECGAILYDTPVVEQLLEDMDNIMAKSQRLEPDKWGKRPLRRKIAGALLRPFAAWM